MDESEPAWEASLLSLYEELMALKGAPSGALMQRPPPPQPQQPERRESAGPRSSTAYAAAAPPVVLEMTMAQKVRQWLMMQRCDDDLTMAQKCGSHHHVVTTARYNREPLDQVARIKEELSLDTALPIAKAVAEANTVMGIEPQGPLAKQVETLLKELGVIS